MEEITKANKSLIKQINTSSILRAIRENGCVSRIEISKITGLTPATVSSSVNRLIKMKLVKEIGSGQSSGGRKPILLELNHESTLILGVHISAKEISLGIVDLDSNILATNVISVGTEKEYQSMLKLIKKGIYDLVEQTKVDFEKIVGLGVAIAGLTDPVKGIVLLFPALNWKYEKIKKDLEVEFNLPVAIENDSRAMALGERWFGVAKDVSNFIFMQVDVGVGSGICMDGKLLTGVTYGAGEIGHIPINTDDTLCVCGRKGCLETKISTAAIIERFGHGLRAGLNCRFCGPNDKPTIEQIVEWGNEGDELSIDVLRETGSYIGIGLSIYINLFNPSMIILGGSVSKAFKIMQNHILKELRVRCFARNIQNLKLCPSSVDNINVVSAATLFISDIFNVKQ